MFLTVGLERKLQASADTAEQLSKDKTKLQNDMSDMMKESGDSSVQLTKMNQDLTEKERYQTLTLCTISSSSGFGQNGLNHVRVMIAFCQILLVCISNKSVFHAVIHLCIIIIIVPFWSLKGFP